MWKNATFIYLLFCTLGLVAQSEVITEPNAKTYALIIGISQYQKPDIPRLNYAHKDAILFYQHLRSELGGSVPSDQLKLLTNEEATIAAIYEGMDWLKKQCNENDLAYIYFSGHGDLESVVGQSKGYFLAYNSPPNNYQNNAVALEELNRDANLLTLERKAKVILITDACHSGKLAGDFHKGKQFVNDQLQQVLNNEVRLTACEVDQEAAEGSQWGDGRGVFSYYLLNGLKGLADLEKDGDLKLNELQTYLKSSLASDKSLIHLGHKQSPVVDGNPNFSLALDNKQSFISTIEEIPNTILPAGLSSFSKAKPQSIDYFFGIIDSISIEERIPFNELIDTTPEAFTLQFMDFFKVPDEHRKIVISDSLTFDEDTFRNGTQASKDRFKYDVYSVLKDELTRSNSLRRQFNQRFIRFVHNKAQVLINAYLSGDIAELENRRYYSNQEGYLKFLAMLNVATHLVPPENHLAFVLKVNQSYLGGLIARLRLTTQGKRDSLLHVAFMHQLTAVDLEPFAAYIHNELGNLYTFKRRPNLDSAKHHYDIATALAPTWVIPWSNKVRMNVMWNRLDEAKAALIMADSLGGDLDFVAINAGKLMEKLNPLDAEAYYLKAIKLNGRSFLPFEGLANTYLNSSRYDLANRMYKLARKVKGGFDIDPDLIEPGTAMNIFETFDPSDNGFFITCEIILRRSDIESPLLDFLTKTYERNVQLDSLKSFVVQNPRTPLAEHYLGQQMILNEKWQEGIGHIEMALYNYLEREAFKKLVKERMQTDSLHLYEEAFCIEKEYVKMHYDIIEDYNLLAYAYEKLDSIKQAINILKKVIQIEQSGGRNRAYAIGPLLLWRLYERSEMHEDAETLIKKYLSIEPGDPMYQQELLRFYKSMVLKFPRNFAWWEKLGKYQYELFLKNSQDWPKIDFTNFSDNLYNYTHSKPSEPDFNQVDMIMQIKGLNRLINVPGFGPNQGLDAVKSFRMAISLSGNVVPDTLLQDYIADIYMRKGMFKEAELIYKERLSTQDNIIIRKRYSDALWLNYKLTEATKTFEDLFKKSALSQEQKMVLLENYLLLNQKRKAKSVFKKSLSHEEKAVEIKKRSTIISHFEKGRVKKAQKAMLDYQKNLKPTFFSEYTSAQLLANNGDEDLAIEKLKVLNDASNIYWLLVKDKRWKIIASNDSFQSLVDESQSDMNEMIEMEIEWEIGRVRNIIRRNN